MNSRVTVRVNATTAGVGERGAVYTTETSAFLDALLAHRVVSRVDTEPTSPPVHGPQPEPEPVDLDTDDGEDVGAGS